MFRFAITAVAAALLTAGAVSAVDAKAPEQVTKVTIDAKTGDYCVAQPAVTGSRIGQSECHSQAEWSKMGVTFSTAPKVVASR